MTPEGFDLEISSCIFFFCFVPYKLARAVALSFYNGPFVFRFLTPYSDTIAFPEKTLAAALFFRHG